MSYAVKADRRTEAELLASTRKTLAEADEISTRTLGTLNGQTQQLERIQDDTEAISQNLDQSDRLLKSMKPFGWLRDMFRSDAPRGHKSSSASAPSAPAKASSGSAAACSGSQGANRLLADEAARQSSRASKQRPDKQGSDMDQAYDEIDQMLDSLKHKSVQMNHTLDHHNKMIPQIVDSVHREDERMQKQQREMKKRLG